MVAGYHLIWTVYGAWIPTDPRGNMSKGIRVEWIKDFGEWHYGRKLVQPPSREVREFYEKVKDRLAHALLVFRPDQFTIIADALASVIRTRGYTCYACAIMPDHVHMLIRRHREKSEEMIEWFQKETKAAVIAARARNVNHPVWGGPGWKVFLNTRADFNRTIKYIRDNPLKIGLPEQDWEFVTRYDGWMPGYRG
jgi:REP element-mobilizing transposase RayT